ncbi:hypothetical protein ACOSQ4_014132 [Xanthoceras sorbifolium]
MRSAPQGEVISLIKEGLQCDSLGKSLMGLANDGKTKRFWVQDDLLYTVGNRLYVPKFGNLRKNLIKECHDTKWAGHPGEVTHHSPFELATGQQPLTLQTVMVGYTGRSPGSYKLAKDWQEQADIARSYLDKAARKMKKWADKKRRRVEFQVGDLVLVKLLPQQFKAFRKVHKGLVRKYEGPFPILKKVGKVSYKVELPPRLKIHPVFHVSHLKPYQADTEDPSRGESSRAPTAVVTSYDKEVEEILADRVVRKRGVPRSSEYLIKWKGLPTSEATWEPKEQEVEISNFECRNKQPEALSDITNGKGSRGFKGNHGEASISGKGKNIKISKSFKGSSTVKGVPKGSTSCAKGKSSSALKKKNALAEVAKEELEDSGVLKHLPQEVVAFKGF